MVLLCTFNKEHDDEAMDFEVCRDMPILMPYFQTNPLLYYPMGAGGSGPELTVSTKYEDFPCWTRVLL